MVRSLQPEVIINNRAGLPGDFDTPECHTGAFQNTRMWETCMPLGKYWAHTEHKIKSTNQILSQLLNCSGGDGNYLLSIGCKPDGSIADNEAQRMREIGDYLRKYGYTVYGTRGGIWKPTAKYASCYKGNTVFLHVLNGAVYTKVTLPLKKNRVNNFECLTGEKIKAETADGALTLKIIGKKFNSLDTIIKIELNNTPVIED